MFISDITYTFSEKVYVYPDIHVHLEQKKPWQRDRNSRKRKRVGMQILDIQPRVFIYECHLNNNICSQYQRLQITFLTIN